MSSLSLLPKQHGRASDKKASKEGGKESPVPDSNTIATSTKATRTVPKDTPTRGHNLPRKPGGKSIVPVNHQCGGNKPIPRPRSGKSRRAFRTGTQNKSGTVPTTATKATATKAKTVRKKKSTATNLRKHVKQSKSLPLSLQSKIPVGSSPARHGQKEKDTTNAASLDTLNTKAEAKPSSHRRHCGRKGSHSVHGTADNDGDDENERDYDIRKPHQNDVLCGRGPSIASHNRTTLWRRLVSESKMSYLQGSSEEKRAVAVGIVQRIKRQRPTGRFLIKGRNMLWQSVEERRAVNKTMQALREDNSTIKAQVQEAIFQKRVAEQFPSVLAAMTTNRLSNEEEGSTKRKSKEPQVVQCLAESIAGCSLTKAKTKETPNSLLLVLLCLCARLAPV